MTFTIPSFHLSSIGPWVTLTVTAILILVLDALSPKGRKACFSWLALAGLAARDAAPALAWCAAHAPRLARAKSSLAFRLRLQQFVELARVGKGMDALTHARTHLAPAAAADGARLAELQAVAGLLAFGPERAAGRYKALLDDSRWAECGDALRADLFRLHAMPARSPMGVRLQAGLTALKPPPGAGEAGARDDPLACAPLAELAAPLPHARPLHSRLVRREWTGIEVWGCWGRGRVRHWPTSGRPARPLRALPIAPLPTPTSRLGLWTHGCHFGRRQPPRRPAQRRGVRRGRPARARRRGRRAGVPGHWRGRARGLPEEGLHFLRGCGQRCRGSARPARPACFLGGPPPHRVCDWPVLACASPPLTPILHRAGE